MDGKIRIATHARIRYIIMSVYIYVLYVHNPAVHGRFYRHDLKMDMVVWKTSYGGR